MSLSNNTDLQTPCTRFFEWSSEQKGLKWYNKETKENVAVKLPFTFLVLDMLSTVKGYSDADQGGIWSNEVRDTRQDILTVRTKKGIKAQGVYADVKNVQGARYCRSVYIAYRENDELHIGNLQLMGAANGEWIEFLKTTKPYGIGIQITGSEAREKGATKFNVPVFKTVPVTEETVAQAVILDKELQEYLKEYFGRKPVEVDDGYTGHVEPPDYVEDAQNVQQAIEDADYAF